MKSLIRRRSELTTVSKEFDGDVTRVESRGRRDFPGGARRATRSSYRGLDEQQCLPSPACHEQLHVPRS